MSPPPYGHWKYKTTRNLKPGRTSLHAIRQGVAAGVKEVLSSLHRKRYSNKRHGIGGICLLFSYRKSFCCMTEDLSVLSVDRVQCL